MLAGAWWTRFCGHPSLFVGRTRGPFTHYKYSTNWVNIIIKIICRKVCHRPHSSTSTPTWLRSRGTTTRTRTTGRWPCGRWGGSWSTLTSCLLKRRKLWRYLFTNDTFLRNMNEVLWNMSKCALFHDQVEEKQECMHWSNFKSKHHSLTLGVIAIFSQWSQLFFYSSFMNC